MPPRDSYRYQPSTPIYGDCTASLHAAAPCRVAPAPSARHVYDDGPHTACTAQHSPTSHRTPRATPSCTRVADPARRRCPQRGACVRRQQSVALLLQRPQPHLAAAAPQQSAAQRLNHQLRGLARARRVLACMTQNTGTGQGVHKHRVPLLELERAWRVVLVDIRGRGSATTRPPQLLLTTWLCRTAGSLHSAMRRRVLRTQTAKNAAIGHQPP